MCRAHKDAIDDFISNMNSEEIGDDLSTEESTETVEEDSAHCATYTTRFGRTISQSCFTDAGSNSDSDEDNAEEEFDVYAESDDDGEENFEKATLDFVKAINLPQVHVAKQDFCELQPKTRNIRARGLRNMVRKMCKILAPKGGSATLSDMVLKFDDSRHSKAKPSKLQTTLKRLGGAFKLSQCKTTQIHDLSIVAGLFPLKELQEYFPGLSSHLFKKARKLALLHGENLPPTDKIKHIRQRYDPVKVQLFLNYATSAEVVTEIPWECTTVKTSAGEEIDIPKLLRDKNQLRIIYNYLKYLEDTDQEAMALSVSTLKRILRWIKGRTRKCIQGLDYFSFMGNEAVDDLKDLVDRLKSLGQKEDWVESKKLQLEEVRQYLRHDYRVHVRNESGVADHCSNYALSDPKDPLLQHTCTHAFAEHTLHCDRCDQMTSVLDDIESMLQSTDYDMRVTNHYKGHDEWLFKHASEAIVHWKMHQLRAAHQNRAREDIIHELRENEAHMTIDFAMKWLPKAQKESMTWWFGKRGIVWHIAVILRRNETTGEFYQRKIVTVLRHSANPNSQITTAIILDVIERIKNEIPELDTLYLRSDNAGYYHSSQTIATIPHISQATSVWIKRYDYSEPQAGKAACDRVAAQVKSHVRLFIAEGNKGRTPEEFVQCATSYKNGVEHTTFVLGSVSPMAARTKDQKPAIPGISSLYNFEFDQNSNMITAWKAYAVGQGKQLPQQYWLGKHNTEILMKESIDTYHEIWAKHGRVHIDTPVEGDRYWETIQPELPTPKKQKVNTVTCDDDDDDDDSQDEAFKPKVSGENSKYNGLWMCKVEGCTRMFKTHKRYKHHMDVGKHENKLIRQTLRDCVYNSYAEITKRAGLYPELKLKEQIEEDITWLRNEPDSVLRWLKGWALKILRKTQDRPLEVRNHLIAKFNEGIETKRKNVPEKIHEEMIKLRTPDNQPQFPNLVSVTQIKSFWAYLSASTQKGQPAERIVTPEKLATDVNNEKMLDEETGIVRTIIAETVYTAESDLEINEEGIRDEFTAEYDKGTCEVPTADSDTTFHIGDMVTMKEVTEDGVKHRLLGPFIIIQGCKDGFFQLKEVETDQFVLRSVHVSQLQPYENPEFTKLRQNGDSAPQQPLWWIYDLYLQQRDKRQLVNGMLDDVHIDAAQKLIYVYFGIPYQMCLLRDHEGFQQVPGPDHVQILFTSEVGGGHWILSILKDNSIVEIVDSFNKDSAGNTKSHIPRDIKRQLGQLYPQAIREGMMTVHILDVQQQTDSNSCGVFAIANAFEKLISGQVELAKYKIQKMRKHLKQVFEEQVIQEFPKKSRDPSDSVLPALVIQLTFD